MKKNLPRLIKQGIKVNIIGEKKRLPKDIIKIVKLIENKTKKNKKITLNLALNYGSKQEIVDACRILIKKKSLYK